jgi:N-carbamoyl-L-amino-acid hydrolase
MISGAMRPKSSNEAAEEVDGERLWSRLMAMAEIGATAAGGSNRQALSDEDAAGRELFAGWAQAAGCEVSVDRIGNVFARRPGTDSTAPPVLCGSHLDTQPTGGRFDGVFGVLGGLEVVERMNDLGLTTRCPVEVAVWTNEEGSRFQHSMMGSAVWAGALGLEEAYGIADVDGRTVQEELERTGWWGEAPAAPRPLTAYLELHIEQGPLLERDGMEIGVVTGVQGLRWYDIRLDGVAAHAGPTPMEGRRDPARAVAGVIDSVYRAAADLAPWGRATFAQFRSLPVSPNTVPATLSCTLDLRHPELAALDELERRMRAGVSAACAPIGVDGQVTKTNDSPPVQFDEGVVAHVRAAAESLEYRHVDIVSGAGHDACYLASVAPTAMIFVPCEDGVSHNETESITPRQAEQGASVLLGAVLRLARVAGLGG